MFKILVPSNDLEILKNLLFKVAECNTAHLQPEKWAQVTCYRNHEKFEQSSIFLEPHLLHSGNAKFEDVYATVTSTLLLLSDKDVIYMFERAYNHDKVREPSEDEERAENLLLDFDNIALKGNDCIYKKAHAEHPIIIDSHH